MGSQITFSQCNSQNTVTEGVMSIRMKRGYKKYEMNLFDLKHVLRYDQCITFEVRNIMAKDYHRKRSKLRYGDHCSTDTNGRKIVGSVQTNPVCWRCQLKRHRSVTRCPLL
ncbi:hypothetical protein TNCV_1993431 [Trichonephila clavipes]|nr:hypothetical protein TNCV_1993431 [Trichonephila clavipes]